MLPLLSENALMVLLVCAGTVSGSSLRSRTPYAVKDTHHVPRSWTPVGPAPAEHMIRLQIGLKQGQFSELERHLYEGTYILNTLFYGHHMAFSLSIFPSLSRQTKSK
jgi:tripeptidyl-peptidase-1